MQTQTFENTTLWLSFAAVAVLLFLPLFLIASYHPEQTSEPVRHSMEVTVGIAVILRATVRRLFRAAARSVFRTTISTITRTSARTFTRRFVRFVMHSLFGLLSRQASTPDGGGQWEQDRKHASLIAIVVSFFALALSFWGVLMLAPDDQRGQAVSELGLPLACALAAVPIFAYGLIVWIAARTMKLSLAITAELDALLLQGYFTGAGSFLPMTTDFECDGDSRQKGRLAAIALFAMFGIYAALDVAGHVADSHVVRFQAAMFLIYCFVYSFPIRPLEGHDLWSSSKTGWLCLFVPVFAAFLFRFPVELTSVL